MAATSRTLSYDALLSTTADKIYKSGAVQDEISNSNVVFNELYKKGKIKKKEVGGDQIAVNLMYELNEPASYSGYDVIDVSPEDGITRMWVPWSQIAGSVSISGIQRFKNMGKEQIADLVKEKVVQLTAGYAQKVSKMLWEVDDLQTSTHPYTANGGKEMIGIPLWVQALGSTANAASGDAGHASTLDMDYDIGNIDQTAETWWMNQAFDAGNSLTDATFKSKLANAYNTCSNGPFGEPDLIVMDQNTYELYEQAMQDQIRYSFSDTASAGFTNLKFKNAKVVWDGYVPDMESASDNNGAYNGGTVTKGTIFLLNTKTMSLYVGKDHDFKPRGFQTPVDQDASTSLYLSYLQLVCANRRKNGVIFDVPLALS
jgi:outer membrane lipoprotein-sorting protein